jgi:hypothetical protein
MFIISAVRSRSLTHALSLSPNQAATTPCFPVRHARPCHRQFLETFNIQFCYLVPIMLICTGLAGGGGEGCTATPCTPFPSPDQAAGPLCPLHEAHVALPWAAHKLHMVNNY